MSEGSTWIKVDAERVLYVHRGRNVILCTEHTFPNGAEFVLRLSAEGVAALRRELDEVWVRQLAQAD
jgi:hypothetical protein